MCSFANKQAIFIHLRRKNNLHHMEWHDLCAAIGNAECLAIDHLHLHICKSTLFFRLSSSTQLSSQKATERNLFYGSFKHLIRFSPSNFYTFNGFYFYYYFISPFSATFIMFDVSLILRFFHWLMCERCIKARVVNNLNVESVLWKISHKSSSLWF